MKITHNKVGQNLNLSDAGRTERAGQAGKSKGVVSKDDMLSALDGPKSSDDSSKVNLSQRAQEIKRAKDLAMAAADVRVDRVADLQKRIDSGNYHVDAKEIADKMVDELDDMFDRMEPNATTH